MVLAATRRSHILDMLRTQGSVSLTQLRAHFPSVSEMTLRRDLDRLQQDGYCNRTHGGAVLAARSIELPYNVRAGHNHNRKLAIAGLARSMVEPRMTVSVDASSTAYVFASQLHAVDNLTIVTTNPTIPAQLRLDADIIVCGGLWKAMAQSVVGPMADEFLSHFTVDIAFIATRCMSPERGMSDVDLLEVSAKRAALRSAKRRVALMDSTKLPSDSVITVVATNELDDLVTDDGLDDEVGAAFERHGVRVHVASLTLAKDATEVVAAS